MQKRLLDDAASDALSKKPWKNMGMEGEKPRRRCLKYIVLESRFLARPTAPARGLKRASTLYRTFILIL